MSIFDQDNLPYDEDGLDRHIRMALEVEKPAGSAVDIAYSIIKRIFIPEIVNPEALPDEPCLFVSNHSLFAADGYILAPLMYSEEGRFLRGLGDRFLWNKKTESMLLNQGGVIGDPKVCSALMENGSDLLVYPGGAHEATKTAAQRYRLQWKDRYGFVRLAAQHGYTILPIAMVGPDEFYTHFMEGEDIPDSALGKILERFGIINENTRLDMLPPIPLGLLGSLIPKPKRCYVKFGKPVRLAEMKGKKQTKKKLMLVREGVADQIESMIADLLLMREQRRGEESFFRRLLTV